MNETPVRRERPSCRWFAAALFWMFVASLLGVAKTWDLWQGTLGMDLAGAIPFGRGFLANQAAFIYGWGVSGLIGVCLAVFPLTGSGSRDWNKVLWGVWQLLVACGVGTALLGQGSGIPSLPVAWWVCPMMAAVLAGLVALIVGGGRQTARSIYALVPAGVALAMTVVAMFRAWWTRGAGMPGVLAVSMLTGMLPFTALAVCLAALLKECAGEKPALLIPALLLLAVAGFVFCPFAGWTSLASWPVPTLLADWGVVLSFGARCLFAIACLAGAYGVAVSKAEGGGNVLSRYAGLIMALLWLAWRWTGPGPEKEQFSIGEWYAMEPALFASVGLMGGAVLFGRLTRCLRLEKYLWVVACLFPLGVFLTSQYASGAVGDEGMMKMAELNSGWLVLIAFLECASWALLGVASVLLLAGMSRAGCFSGENPVSGGRFSWGRVLIFGGMAVVVAGSVLWALAKVDAAGREVIPFASLRPGGVSEGAAVYAGEGCGLCHTQIARRLPSGRDVQGLIDYGRQGDVPYRVSEPQDYDPAMDEGMAQIGVARIGPDLFNLAARAGGYVTYRDADGEERRVASEREWLLFHLYHPQDPLFGKPWTTCPPMNFLFEERPLPGAGRSADALPVKCREGFEIVPSRRASELVDYLLALKRASSPGSAGDESNAARQPWSHVSSDYAAHRALIDFSPIEKEKTARIMQRGRQIFLVRCSVCHGEDGMGDQVNYPPLNGSEWLMEKKPEELVSVIRYGLKGPVAVKGRKWDSVMLPPGVVAQKELAPLMTYLLRTFGKREMEPVGGEQAEEWWNRAVSR